jgi:protein CpxP
MKKISLAAIGLSFIMGSMAFASATNSDASTPSSDQTMTTSSSDQMGKKGGCGEHLKKMISALNLDASQQAKIKGIKDQLKQSQQSNWEQMKSIRSQIHDLITSETMDDSRLNSLINQKKELLGEMMKAKINAKHQIYNTLNEQQKSQFRQMMQQWEAERKHHKC